jgi:hypothetical protein
VQHNRGREREGGEEKRHLSTMNDIVSVAEPAFGVDDELLVESSCGEHLLSSVRGAQGDGVHRAVVRLLDLFARVQVGDHHGA